MSGIKMGYYCNSCDSVAIISVGYNEAMLQCPFKYTLIPMYIDIGIFHAYNVPRELLFKQRWSIVQMG